MSSRLRVNRKKNTGGYIIPAPLTMIVVMAGALGLSYLWLCSRCEVLGQGLKRLEQDKARVHKLRLNEEYKWANMKSPVNIEKALKTHCLDMRWPERHQVIRLHKVDYALADMVLAVEAPEPGADKVAMK